MKRRKVRVLIIEDKIKLAEDAQREITDSFEDNEEIDVQVSIATDFDEGFSRVQNGESDVVVLDVRRDATASVPEDDLAGHARYLDIKKARFAPVVFWTALPEKVIAEQMPPLVTVVTKENTEQLPAAIVAAVESRALETIDKIEQHVALVLTNHMWDELAPNWTEYTADGDATDIAQVLLSRLARIIDDEREQANASHPSHRYVYPPPASTRRAPGDILRDENQEWWVALTSACDFAQNKVEFVLVARADPLKSNARYQKWATSNSRGSWNELERNILRATQGRYYYLPSFREIPDLVLDLENVKAIKVNDLETMEPVASLVSPFSEALLVQHSQFRGRIGVPDLNVALVQTRLLSDGTAD